MIPPEIEAKIPALEAKFNGRGSATGKATLREFLTALYESEGSAYKTAKVLGMSHQMAADRRNRIEQETGVQMPRGRPETWRSREGLNRIIDVQIQNGTVMVGSDLHKKKGLKGTAERAFIALNGMLKPDYVVLNGDGIDGKKIARHARIGWEEQDTPADELEAIQTFSKEVIDQNPNGKYWRTRGNHDELFDAYFSNRVSAMEGVPGTKLADHLQMWTECVSVIINRGEPGHHIVKHRFRKSGVHADWNNLIHAGVHITFGHLHCQRVRAFTDARGTRYACDAGMLAPVDGPQFAYCEADVNDWRSGFVVHTYVNGLLMPPEKVEVLNEDEGIIYFRGQRWQV